MPNITWPWGVGVQSDPMQTKTTKPEGTVTVPFVESGEWSFPNWVQRTVSSATANAQRLLSSTQSPAVKQAEPLPTGPAWYDIPGRIAVGASAVNEAFQSTLIKVIVVLAIVGVVAVFGMSFLQAKGASLGKA